VLPGRRALLLRRRALPLHRQAARCRDRALLLPRAHVRPQRRTLPADRSGRIRRGSQPLHLRRE
jgi:hypothetical protein